MSDLNSHLHICLLMCVIYEASYSQDIKMLLMYNHPPYYMYIYLLVEHVLYIYTHNCTVIPTMWFYAIKKLDFIRNL